MSQIPLKFVSHVGTANGLATLDGSGKIPAAQLPSTVLEYQGLWNPSTNTPTLQDSTGTNGFVYQISAAFAGPISGLANATMVNFQVGNLVIFSSALGQWQQAASASGVVSVNGAQGVVIVNAINQLTGDVTTGAASGSQSKATTLVATSNSTLTTLSALSLPGTQVTGNIAGNAANITATSNSTLTTLSVLSLPYSQITGGPAAITALTGDATASGPGSSALTLATVNSNVGSFTNASITVNTKGLVTAASSAATTGTGSTVLATSPTITNPIVGTQSQGNNSTTAASTAYVDTAVANAVAGVNPAVAVQAATIAASDTSGLTYNNGVSGVGATLTGSNNTPIVIDGFTFTAIGQRLLVKNDTQSPSGAFNGIYNVTQIQTSLLPPILTRALDYDTPSDINNTGAIPVVNGTVNGTTSWVQTAQIVTVGTSPLVFTQFSINPSTVLTNPMTTGGDIIYGGSGGTPTRLANGSAGQFLKSQGTTLAPVWATAIATAAYNVVSKTTTYNAVANDYILASSSAFSITLPTAVGISGQSIVVKKTDSSLANIITILTTSAQTIDGLASGVITVNTLSELYIFTSDGSNWSIAEHGTNTGIISVGNIHLSSTSAYTFTITSATVVAGDQYSNNSQTFQVTSSGTVTSMPASGTGAPSASGTLTRTSGTGPATLTFSAVSTNAPAISGGAAANNYSWYRQGRYAYITYRMEQASGAGGSGDYVPYLPTGMTIDSSITPMFGSVGTFLVNVAGATNSLIPSYGYSFYQSTSYLINGVFISAYSTSSFRLASVTNQPTSFNWGSGNFSLASANTMFFGLTIAVPISGWQP